MATLATTLCADKHCSGEVDCSVHRPCTSSLVSSDNVDHRLVRQKAAEFLREAEKNRRQIEKLAKERTLSVQCRKSGWTDVSGELEECEKVLEEERNAEKMNLQKQLVKIHNGVRKFQRQLTDVKPTPELIKRLEEIMSEVEISINTLKEEQQSCFEELLKEERTCRQEITAYEKKIENWSLAVRPQSDPKLPTASTVKKTKPVDRNLPAEVRAVEAFLQKTGGPYGGWDQYDHQAFLKAWTKHSGKPAYRKEAKLYLPAKKLEEIEQHEDWYQELINLQNRKREAIQRWKSNKHQERQTRIQEEAQEAQEAERREEAKNQASTEEERMMAAWQLEVWRAKKRINKEHEEKQRLAEKIRKGKQQKEERRRHLEVKLGIEEQLRLRREEEEEQERRRREEKQREMDERRKEAAKGIKRFCERDLHKVEAKLQEKRRREKEEEERQKRNAKLKEKVDGQVHRDPSRLIRPTKGWAERVKHIGPSGGGPVLQMFHRAVPTWRQGL
ncbi:coiled-coil domain-containing protein 112 [Pempheris klunzingeri]|uniref:coiled-coil domain-containing protein 112 n=1 Tax=Pempheris klunzingeri TaxID=3127111 RepID=UPI00397E9502